jgi:hypothetical protein
MSRAPVAARREVLIAPSNQRSKMSSLAGGTARIVAIAIILLWSSQAAAVSLIENKLPTTWSQSIFEFVQHYIEVYSKYDEKRQEGVKQDVIPKLEHDLLAIAVGSEVLATALEDVSRGRESPQRLGLLATKIHRSVESTVSLIRSIDPNWTRGGPSADFLKALDQFQKEKFDLVDGRIWELLSARDMKPDETRQLALALRLEAQQLVETIKRLILGTGAY